MVRAAFLLAVATAVLSTLASGAFLIPSQKASSQAFRHIVANGASRSSSASFSSIKLKASAGFGFSTAESTKDAVLEAVETAKSSITAAGPSIAFVSCTVGRDVDEVQREFVSALPDNIPIHGATSSGALLTSDGAKGNAVGCLLLSGESEGSYVASYDAQDGKAAAMALKRKMDSPQVILMAATPGAEEGIIDELANIFPNVPVYGGTAADDELSGAWKVFASEGVPSATGVSLVALGPNVKFGASMLGPYTETTTKVTATKTDGGRRVLEIDNKPAADWVYNWLGSDVGDAYVNGGLILPQTAQKPIGIKQPSGEFVTNHLAALGGSEDKFVDFFAPIPQGSELVIMDSGDGPQTGYANALNDAYDEAKASLNGQDPKAGILVFCGGMAIAVGDNLDSGLSSADFASKVQGLPMLGVTAFGEQAQLNKEKKNVQRNLSVGMLLFG